LDDLRQQEARLRLEERRLQAEWLNADNRLTDEERRDLEVRVMILSTELEDVRAFRGAVRDRLIDLELAGDGV